MKYNHKTRQFLMSCALLMKKADNAKCIAINGEVVDGKFKRQLMSVLRQAVVLYEESVR